MNLEEKTLSSQLIFDGKVVHLYKDDVELPNGRTAFREYIKHNPKKTLYYIKIFSIFNFAFLLLLTGIMFFVV